jgi:hypothetical protein
VEQHKPYRVWICLSGHNCSHSMKQHSPRKVRTTILKHISSKTYTSGFTAKGNSTPSTCCPSPSGLKPLQVDTGPEVGKESYGAAVGAGAAASSASASPVGGAHRLFTVIPRGDEPIRRRQVSNKKSSSSPGATLPPTSLLIDRTLRSIFAGAFIQEPHLTVRL